MEHRKHRKSPSVAVSIHFLINAWSMVDFEGSWPDTLQLVIGLTKESGSETRQPAIGCHDLLACWWKEVWGFTAMNGVPLTEMVSTEKREHLSVCPRPSIKTEHLDTQTATRNSLSCFLHSSPVWFLFYLCVVFIWVFILLLAPIFPPKAVESDWCSVHRSKMSSNWCNRLLDH